MSVSTRWQIMDSENVLPIETRDALRRLLRCDFLNHELDEHYIRELEALNAGAGRGLPGIESIVEALQQGHRVRVEDRS